jgi:lysophospholipase L1-like esterase
MVCLGLAILLSALWAEIILYSENSLYLNNKWLVSKRLAEVGVMGGDEFLTSRSPLARNVLNLNAWYGFQEVIFRPSLSVAQMSFEFRIPDGSYFDFTFGRKNGQFFGLRLSNQNDQPSMAFVSEEEGKFIKRIPLKLSFFPSSWHQAVVSFLPLGMTALQIDGQSAVSLPAEFSGEGQIGFRGSYEAAWIDDVTILLSNGQTLHANFKNSDRWWEAFFGNLLLLLLCVGGAWWLYGGASFALPSALWLSIALVCSGCWYCFDFYFWSAQPISLLTRPLASEHHKTGLNYLESIRADLISAWYRILGGVQVTQAGVSERGYPMVRVWQGPIYCSGGQCTALSDGQWESLSSSRKQGYRVLFIGTSQTVGACAQKLEHSFFVRTSRIMNASQKLESLNMSVSGSDSNRLFDDYEKHYLRFAPDLAVINLSVNDRLIGFEEEIEKFVSLNQSLGIKTVLIEEASFSEFQPEKMAKMHQILRQVGERYNLPVYPLHDFLDQLSVKSTGWLWCDMVHLTSYGQDLVAQWLAPKLVHAIQSQNPQKTKIR